MPRRRVQHRHHGGASVYSDMFAFMQCTIGYGKVSGFVLMNMCRLLKTAMKKQHETLDEKLVAATWERMISTISDKLEEEEEKQIANHLRECPMNYKYGFKFDPSESDPTRCLNGIFANDDEEDSTMLTNSEFHKRAMPYYAELFRLAGLDSLYATQYCGYIKCNGDYDAVWNVVKASKNFDMVLIRLMLMEKIVDEKEQTFLAPLPYVKCDLDKYTTLGETDVEVDLDNPFTFLGSYDLNAFDRSKIEKEYFDLFTAKYKGLAVFFFRHLMKGKINSQAVIELFEQLMYKGTIGNYSAYNLVSTPNMDRELLFDERMKCHIFGVYCALRLNIPYSGMTCNPSSFNLGISNPAGVLVTSIYTDTSAKMKTILEQGNGQGSGFRFSIGTSDYDVFSNPVYANGDENSKNKYEVKRFKWGERKFDESKKVDSIEYGPVATSFQETRNYKTKLHVLYGVDNTSGYAQSKSRAPGLFVDDNGTVPGRFENDNFVYGMSLTGKSPTPRKPGDMGVAPHMVN